MVAPESAIHPRTHNAASKREQQRNQMRRTTAEKATSGGGAWLLDREASPNNTGNASAMVTGLAATPACGVIARTLFDVTAATSVRTTVLQQDISMRPHCPAIFSQQSISSCVMCRSGKKHAIWGTNPHTITTVSAKSLKNAGTNE